MRWQSLACSGVPPPRLQPSAGKAEGRATRARPSGTNSVVISRSLGSCGLDLLDVDRLAAALGAELHGAGDEGEERVVATATDALARVEVRAALTDEDLAR